MKKAFILFLFLFFCISISEAVVVGISPSKRDIEITKGETRDVQFGLSTNSEELITMTCETESDYLYCSDTLTAKKGEITYFNVTIEIPIDYESNELTESFLICKQQDMIRSCLEGRVNVEIQEVEETLNIKMILIFIFIFFIISILFLKTNLKNYFK